MAGCVSWQASPQAAFRRQGRSFFSYRFRRAWWFAAVGQQRTLANVCLWSRFVNGHDLAADGGVGGGCMWTPHQVPVRHMKAAFGIEG
jgi:hypothetical protein